SSKVADFFAGETLPGMGAEWPAGAALAMETWPARSRGFMSGVLQGSWGLGFALSSIAYGFLYDYRGETLRQVARVLAVDRSAKENRREDFHGCHRYTEANVPWWKEPTRDQWKAYVAAWLGWTLDAFDFTIFLLIMVPIAKGV